MLLDAEKTESFFKNRKNNLNPNDNIRAQIKLDIENYVQEVRFVDMIVLDFIVSFLIQKKKKKNRFQYEIILILGHQVWRWSQ